MSFNPSTQIVGTATVNSVSINSTSLPYKSSNNDYSYSTNSSLGFPPATWVVNGIGTISSFTYTSTTPLPIFAGLSSFPSTINKTQNLVIPITGASGYDQIEIQVLDSLNKKTSVFIANGLTSVTVLKDSLTKLTNCNSASISINLIKYNPQMLNGKNFLFATLYATGKQNIQLH